MKNLLIVLYIMFVCDAVAQIDSEKDIPGVYRVRSNDPAGGATMILLPDHSYVIAYFGGVQKGNWEFADGRVYLTVSAEPQFALYGRTLSSLGNRTQINFQIDPSNAVLVGFEPKNKPSLTPVFNQDANCFKFPYIVGQQEKIVHISAAQGQPQMANNHVEDIHDAIVYHFEIPSAYNDLLLINLPISYTVESTTSVAFKDGLLYIDGNQGVPGEPLESLSKEDMNFMAQYSDKSLFPEQLQRNNEFFPYSENSEQKDFTAYNRIETLKLSRQEVRIQQEPLFKVTCYEEE